VAVTYLSAIGGLSPSQERYESQWPKFLATLDHTPSSATAELRAAARQADVTIVLARHRLVAHPLVDRTVMWGRDGEGRLTHRGRVRMPSDDPEVEMADAEIRAINQEPPAHVRLTAEDRWELTQGLSRLGEHLNGSQRNRYKKAVRDMGIHLEFELAAESLVRLVESLRALSTQAETSHDESP
jgi:hypothetical protein